MQTSNRNRSSSFSALAALLLIALAAFSPATFTSGAPTVQTGTPGTVNTFSDGASSKTFAFASAAWDTSASIALPFDAVVDGATMDVLIALGSASSAGTLWVDVGNDGWFESSVRVVGSEVKHLDLGSAGCNKFLRERGALSGNVNVPVALRASSDGGTLSLTFRTLSVSFTSGVVATGGPAFSGTIGDFGVVAGGASKAVYDVAAHFSAPAGDHVKYAAAVATSAAANAGVTVEMVGSLVNIGCTNPNWFGDVVITFFSEAEGRIAKSNNVTVHVVPAVPDADVPVTDIHQGGGTNIPSTACLTPGLTEHFKLPKGSVVASASVDLDLGTSVSTALGTIVIGLGSDTMATVNLSELPKRVSLSVTPLNTQLSAASAVWGIVDLGIAVTSCPIGGVAEIKVSNVTLSYTILGSGGPGGCVCLPSIERILVNGEATATATADTALALVAQTNTSLPSGATVSWFVDTVFSGSGAAISNIVLTAGEHVVACQLLFANVTSTFTTTISAIASGSVTGQMPRITEILVNGASNAVVEAGSALSLGFVANATMPAGAQVTWIVDTAVAGSGAALTNLVLSAGEHLCAVQVVLGQATQVFSVVIRAVESASAAAEIPRITGILINGAERATVVAEESLSLAFVANATMPVNSQVTWLVDTVVVGSGQTVSNIMLSAGQHVVAVECVSGNVTKTFSAVVAATASGAGSTQLPAITGISLNGAAESVVSSGTAMTLALIANGPLPAAAQTVWSLNGQVIGTGQVLTNVVLAPGVNTITAVCTNGSATSTVSTMVTAAPSLVLVLTSPAASAASVVGNTLVVAGNTGGVPAVVTIVHKMAGGAEVSTVVVSTLEASSGLCTFTAIIPAVTGGVSQTVSVTAQAIAGAFGSGSSNASGGGSGSASGSASASTSFTYTAQASGELITLAALQQTVSKPFLWVNGTTCECVSDVVINGASYATANGAFAVRVPLPAASGTYAIDVTAMDQAGNTQTVHATAVLNLSALLAAGTAITCNGGSSCSSVAAGAAAQFALSTAVPAGVQVVWMVDGVQVATGASATLTLAAGAHTVDCVATDGSQTQTMSRQVEAQSAGASAGGMVLESPMVVGAALAAIAATAGLLVHRRRKSRSV